MGVKCVVKGGYRAIPFLFHSFPLGVDAALCRPASPLGLDEDL
jgi:hypothetical protein